MTNFEWIRSLTMEELSNIFFGSRCSTCAYKERVDCPTDKNGCYDCKGGFEKWCNAIHAPEAKPCPVCKGKMDARWQHNGCYLVCEDCGMHFGIVTDRAEEGIIEGDYAEEAALVDDWNRRFDDEHE